jgi:hypothetical protein
VLGARCHYLAAMLGTIGAEITSAGSPLPSQYRQTRSDHPDLVSLTTCGTTPLEMGEKNSAYFNDLDARGFLQASRYPKPSAINLRSDRQNRPSSTVIHWPNLSNFINFYLNKFIDSCRISS